MDVKNTIVISALIVASIQDIRKREVSNVLSIAILIVSLLNFKIENIIGLIIAPLPMVLTNMQIKDNFGGADIKIIAALGFCYGIKKALIIFIIALSIEYVFKKLRKEESEPLIPFILIGYLITFLSMKG